MNEMTFDEAIEALKHAVYGEEVRYAIARALVLSMNTQQSVAGKEDASNKVTSMDSNSTDVQYPSAKSVYDALSGKENGSNKKTTLTGNESSNNFYLTAKAVADALSTKAPLSTAYTFDDITTDVVYNANNPKIIYTRALVNSKNAIVLTSSGNYYQLAFCYDGTEYTRHLTSGGSTTYNPWLVVKNENTNNKKSEINDSNRTSTDFYPSIKAVVDYLVANYENLSNKLSSEDGIDEDSTDTKYPTAKAVFDYGVQIHNDIDNDITNINSALQSKENFANKQGSITNANKTSGQYYPSIKAVVDYLVANYENLSNKLTSEEGIDSNSTDTEYPSAKAVHDLGVEILALVNDDISNVESRLVLKESFSNKKNAIAGNETSGQYYPTTKAVYDYGSQISSAVEDVKAYIGYTSGDILGLHADFENKVFTRLGAAVGLNAGSDFDAFPMYGQRRRVVVGSDGVIIDGYSPEDVGESDTDVDVMVYQPKFYYKVVPLKLEKRSSGLGYHIRKANYYISSTPHAGFKLHPLFFDKNGNEIDYVLFSAYEASYMWRRQVSSTNGYADTIFHDGVDTDTTIDTSAVLKSLPGVKPISGQYKEMNKVNMEKCAQRKSSNWHIDTIKSVSANQLLMAIEYASFNTQSAIGLGIVSNTNSGTNNCSSLTGSTSALGNATGMASETIYDVAGTEIPFDTNGKLAVSYRGIENPWGNIWKHVNGINLWNDGQMGSGQVYIADDFSFNESSHSGKYKSSGLTLPSVGGYVSAFGYGNKEYDWLFIPSETTGNSSVPISDYYYCSKNILEYRILNFGGAWDGNTAVGYFCFNSSGAPNTRFHQFGGRLLYVPTATV